MTKDEALKLAQKALSNKNAPAKTIYEALAAIKEALTQPQPMRLRRGDILRCIETDKLCTVWSTSTTGKTLIKWGANDFGGYTAEQIGELFWLEPSPDDLELAAEKSDNYAAFHAGYRFAVAHPLAQPEQEPCGGCGGSGWIPRDLDIGTDQECFVCEGTGKNIDTTPPQRKPLTDAMEYDLDWCDEAAAELRRMHDLLGKANALCRIRAEEIERLKEQPQPWEKFCDSNCVWTDHHPDCKLAQPDQYAKGYADAMNWKVQNHLEHLPAAQPEQEPVAWCVYCDGQFNLNIFRVKDVADVKKVRLDLEYPNHKRKVVPLYTSPPQRKPLTDEEIKTNWPNTSFDFSEGVEDVLMFARAIEAAHGIKELA